MPELTLVETLEEVGMKVVTVDEQTFDPFIDGVQYAWDSTCIERLKRCGRLRKYKLDGWEPKSESIALRFGREYHQALHDYEVLLAEKYKHRDAVFEVIRALTLRLEDWDPDDKKRNRSTLLRTVIWYLEKFKDDPAKTLILASGAPAVEIRFSFDLPYDIEAAPGQPYVLSGKLDRVVTFNGDLFVMDRKTTTWGLGSSYWNLWTPHNQISLYTLAGKQVFQAPIKGVIIDAAQLLVGGVNFERGIIYRTQEQLDEWVEDLIPFLLRQNDFGHNDTSCDKYGGCEFREVCGKSPQVRDRFLRSAFEQVTPWNPLAPR